MTDIAIRDKELTFSEEQVALIKRTIAPDLNNDELAMFLHFCKSHGMDPLSRHVYPVKRRSSKYGDRVAFQTGIDGLRLNAERTGNYAGSDDSVFTYASGDEEKKKPVSATVTVYKIVQGQRCGFSATARWSEYYPGEPQGFMWVRMPHVMLGKCAEALALRKAFPAELYGIYAHEEMQQADSYTIPESRPERPEPRIEYDEAVPPPTDEDLIPLPDEELIPAVKMATPNQVRFLNNLAKKFFKADTPELSADMQKDFLQVNHNVTSFEELSLHDAKVLIDSILKSIGRK